MAGRGAIINASSVAALMPKAFRSSALYAGFKQTDLR